MTERSRLQAFHPEEALHHLLENIKAIIENPRVERNMLVALSATVAKLVEEVRANSDLAKSAVAAQAVLGLQIEDLKASVATLKAGSVTNEEDLAAVNEAVSTLDETNKALGPAVPANTPADPAPTVETVPPAEAPAEPPPA